MSCVQNIKITARISFQSDFKSGQRKIQGEYTTILAHNQKGPLKQVVQACDLRPVSPQIGASSFTCWTNVGPVGYFGNVGRRYVN